MDIQQVTNLLIQHEGYCTVPGSCDECCYDKICDRIKDVDMKLKRFKSAKIIKENNYDIDFFFFEEVL